MKLITKNIGLGKRIKAIRVQLGKNQAEFGELFDPPAPKGAVSRWEHGGGPNKKRLKKIADLGGVSVDYLINGSHASNKEIRYLVDKALNSPANLEKEEQQKINASMLDIQALAETIGNSWNRRSQERINKENAIINQFPFSPIDLEIYSFFLSLLNLVRLSGTKDQQVSFSVLITMMTNIASGVAAYDKGDMLPMIDEFLSSFPIKDRKKNPDSSKPDNSK